MAADKGRGQSGTRLSVCPTGLLGRHQPLLTFKLIQCLGGLIWCSRSQMGKIDLREKTIVQIVRAKEQRWGAPWMRR